MPPKCSLMFLAKPPPSNLRFLEAETEVGSLQSPRRGRTKQNTNNKDNK